MDCPFCGIGDGTVSAVIVWEDPDVLAFLDRRPIREGHCQIIPRQHVETFEQLSPDLAAKVLDLGQRLARRMKAIYSVDRVAFLFTGGDVPHVHAHVVPIHEKTDITSGRYILSPDRLQFGSSHLRADRESLLAAKARLRFA